MWEKPKLAGSLFIFCLSLLLTSTTHASGANGSEMIREKCLYQILLLRIILRLPNKQDLLKALPMQKQQKMCFQKGDLKRPAQSIVLREGSWLCLFGDRTSLPLSWGCHRACVPLHRSWTSCLGMSQYTERKQNNNKTRYRHREQS